MEGSFSDLRKEYKDVKLPILTMKLSKEELKLINLIRMGLTQKDNRLRKAKLKRNILREEILEKLKLWENDKSNKLLNMSYSDVLDYDKFKISLEKEE